jgi:hypothetical protein
MDSVSSIRSGLNYITNILFLAVTYKEREFVKQFIVTNPMAVEAIRSGWLLDMKQRTPEEYIKIIEEMEQSDMDNRESLRKTSVFKELMSDSLSTSVVSINLDEYEPPKDTRRSSSRLSLPSDNNSISSTRLSLPSKHSPPRRSTKTTSPNRVLTPPQQSTEKYINEIQKLRTELAQKNEELKNKSLMIGVDDIIVLSRADLKDLLVSMKGTKSNYDITLTTRTIMFLDQQSYDIAEEVPFKRISRVSHNIIFQMNYILTFANRLLY